MNKQLKDVLEVINIYDPILISINNERTIIYANKDLIDKEYLNSTVDCIGTTVPRLGIYKNMPCLLVDIWTE